MADWIKRLPFPKAGEDVVISGIAGRFPSCDTLAQLKENLFTKVDLIAEVDTRWKSDDPDVPRRTVRVNHMEKFDAKFFGVGYMEAHKMDPMARMLLEHSYEAILDAGINPGELRGTKTGVYIGNCYCESANNWLYGTCQVKQGLPAYGELKKPTYPDFLDLLFAGVSSAAGLSSRALESPISCDQVVENHTSPEYFEAILSSCIAFHHLSGVLSSDRGCRSFDADGDGYCRSEAVSVIYLQRSKDAKRIYAQVVHSKINCDSYKEEGITFPSRDMQSALLQQFYEECKIAPSTLAYVEAHGTGTKVGDPVEVDTLERIFCPGRTTPLRIGSIKSNLGHTEPVSGLCSIAKVSWATTIPKEGIVHLTVMVQKGSGRFEVVQGGSAVVTGFIRVVSNPAQQRVSTGMLIDSHGELDLTSKDIYKEFRLRGYQYTGVFRGLREALSKGTIGRIAWERNWVAFMDIMLQMRLLGIDTRGLFVPTGIEKVVIDTKAHTSQIRAMHDRNKEFGVRVYEDLDIIVSGGIEIRWLKISSIGRKKPTGEPVLENFKFVAHRDGAEIGLAEAIRIATQIALENHSSIKIKSIELQFLSDLPLLRANIIIIAPKGKYAENALPSTVEILDPQKLTTEFDALLVVSHGLLASKNSVMLKQLRKATKDGGFLLAREPLNADCDVFSTIRNEGFDIIMEIEGDSSGDRNK